MNRRISVVTTASTHTIDCAEALRTTIEEVWRDADLYILVSERVQTPPTHWSTVSVGETHGTNFAVSGILSEDDQLSLALPALMTDLLKGYEYCLFLGPRLLVARPPIGLLEAATEKGGAVAVPTTVRPLHAFSPSIQALDRGPYLPDKRVLAVTRQGHNLLEEWAETVREAVLDVDQRPITWATEVFLQRAHARPETTVEGESTLIHWADYAAIEAGRALGPEAAIVDCAELFDSARKADSWRDPEVAWDLLVHQVHDSRPVEPFVKLIEQAQGLVPPDKETPFDKLLAEIRRAADPWGRRWGVSPESATDFRNWLYEKNPRGCTRLADFLARSDSELFRSFPNVRFDPRPFRKWIEMGGRDILGFDPFDPSYQPRVPKNSIKEDPSDSLLNALRWRWTVVKSLTPGHLRRLEARQDREFLGVDPKDKRGLNPPRYVEVVRETPMWGESPRSVNLLGPFRSESGLGQAARATLAAVRHLDMPFAAVDLTDKYPSRNAVDVGLTAADFGQLGDVNLIHTNADEMLTLKGTAVKHRFAGRFNAAMWFWETADLPKRSRPAFNHVDELWVASEYLKDVFGQYARVPIHVIGLAADLPSERDVDRSRLGFREGELVFLFVYDALSSYGRKNPQKAIQAFIEAFQPSFSDVRFVLKVSNLNKFPASQQEIYAIRDRYPAVTVVDEYLPHDEVLDLMAASDVYVSLHAAEGFGLTLLEAMALGTPVMCTGYSGNMDFTTPENSWLVDYEMMATTERTGPYPEGSIWASPNVDHATEIMRHIASNRQEIAAKSRLAKVEAQAAASLENYANRLEKQLHRVL